MDKNKKMKAEKQTAFEKSKQELSDVSKEVESVKLKLFEILQSGSDDTVFSNWAKRKIHENGNSANPEKPATQNCQSHSQQNQNQRQ